MTKVQKKMLQRVYTGEKEKTTTSFAVSFFLDYKMVMAKHIFGDIFTIKSIIENQRHKLQQVS
jgi:hypothetical protein